MLSLILAGFAAFIWTRIFIDVWRSEPFLRPLATVEPGPADGPMLSVIVPARNEEKVLATCLATLAQQTYGPLEIIAIDDRSTDATGRLADEAAAASGGRIRALHITELPPGWLGKCNALQTGALGARGEYLLFTDGDVIFSPDALARAMGEVVRTGADHLVVYPGLITHSLAEQAIIVFFALTFLAAMPPNRVLDPQFTAGVGVGAFNLVRRSTYDRVGGHATLRLNVLDDVQLGELMKVGGAKMAILVGKQLVRVKWQESVWGYVRGLEKNAFANVDYSVVWGVGMIVSMVWIFVYPYAGMFWGLWVSRITCMVIVVLASTMGVLTARKSKLNPASGVLIPLGALLLAYAFARSVFITLRRGGVSWRDSFYSVHELRAWMRGFRARKRELWIETQARRKNQAS